MKGLAIVLSLLTFIAFGAAIYLSRGERWVTVLFCGIGLIAAGFVVIVAREVAGGIVVGQLVTEESIRPAADEAWSISTAIMSSIATTVIVIGAFFVVAGWLASPADSAKSARRWMAPALREYPTYVYAGLAILVGLYFLSAPTQNLRSFLTTLVVAGLAAFGIHELRRQSYEEYPDATYDDVFGRTKDKVVDAVKSANLGERASKLGEKLPDVKMPEGGGDNRRRGAKRRRATKPTRASPASSGSGTCMRRACSATRSSPPRSRASSMPPRIEVSRPGQGAQVAIGVAIAR